TQGQRRGVNPPLPSLLALRQRTNDQFSSLRPSDLSFHPRPAPLLPDGRTVCTREFSVRNPTCLANIVGHIGLQRLPSPQGDEESADRRSAGRTGASDERLHRWTARPTLPVRNRRSTSTSSASTFRRWGTAP